MEVFAECRVGETPEFNNFSFRFVQKKISALRILFVKPVFFQIFGSKVYQLVSVSGESSAGHSRLHEPSFFVSSKGHYSWTFVLGS